MPKAANCRGLSRSGCRASARAGDGLSCPGFSPAKEGFPQALRATFPQVLPQPSRAYCNAHQSLQLSTTLLRSQGQGIPRQHPHPLFLLLQYLLLSP